jgi:phage gpG-like protein
VKLFAVTRGGKRSKEVLANMDERLRIVLGETLAEGALRIHATAVKSIQAQASRGARTTRYNPKREVVVSRPGDPPNSDTGRLAQSIKFEIDQKKLRAWVGTNVRYGAFLEFGSLSTGLEPRPWLAPASREHEEWIKAAFRNAVKNAVARLRSSRRAAA